jgi:hypothetical protein
MHPFMKEEGGEETNLSVKTEVVFVAVLLAGLLALLVCLGSMCWLSCQLACVVGLHLVCT